MSSAIISAEIVCAIMMLIVGYAITTERRKELSHKLFVGCIISVFFILLCDSFSYIYDGNSSLTTLSFVLNLLTLVVGDVLMLFFGFYVWSLVEEKKQINIFGKQYRFIIVLICLIDFIFEFYVALTRQSFDIVNGYFVAGPLYDIGFYVELFVLSFIFVYLIINKQTIGFKTILVFIVYYFFPVISIVIIIINPVCSFICSSTAMSFLVIYIGIEKEKESRDIIMSQLVNTDILTNLNNRYAYEEKLKSLTESKDTKNVGVIFCDLNRLKVVNDDYGHEAGDQYIVRFSKILIKCFGIKNLYRISGDEFIVILDGINKKDFEEVFSKLHETVIAEDHIASCGRDFGEEKNISNIVKAAEQDMYQDKHQYYIEFGINRRRS